MFHPFVVFKMVPEQFAYKIKSRQEYPVPYRFQDMSAFFWVSGIIFGSAFNYSSLDCGKILALYKSIQPDPNRMKI